MNRCAVLLCLGLAVCAVSAWNDRKDYDHRGRRDSYSRDSRDSSDYGRYHHAGDWSNQQSATSYCDRYAHDPYKHAKCQAQRAPRPPAQDPRCQKYVFDDDEPYKLVMCEQRAKGPTTQVPQCQHFEYDPYKLAKCEHKAQHTQGSYQGGPLKAPQCGRYIHDLYKLSTCEDRAEGPATQVPQCQQFAYDPYKLAKCEHKADFWNEFKFDPAYLTSTNPACQRYSYDPYKMQRCDYKISKMVQGQSADM